MPKIKKQDNPKTNYKMKDRSKDDTKNEKSKTKSKNQKSKTISRNQKSNTNL